MNGAAVRQSRGSGPRGRFLQPALYALALGLLLAGLAGADARAKIVIVTYGDSLSAGLGLREAEAFPAQLEKALKARGHDVRVVDASVSGDTTDAALKRFEWSFPKEAHGAIVELGANDALRGLEPDKTRANLDKLISRIKAKGVETLLAGMLAPRNLGAEYTEKFDSIYPELAKKHSVPLYPFFLFDVVGKRALNQDDGVHPNARGVKKIVEQILPRVEELVERVKAREGRAR